MRVGITERVCRDVNKRYKHKFEMGYGFMFVYDEEHPRPFPQVLLFAKLVG